MKGYCVSKVCRIIEIKRTQYYYRLTHKEKRSRYTMKEIYLVENTFREHHGSFGRRMIREILKAQGILMSQRKISAIMKKQGLRSKYGRKKGKNVYTDEETSEKFINENYLKQMSDVQRQQHKIWSMDFTEQKTKNDKKTYICGIIDINGKTIVSYNMAKKCTAELAVKTLQKAVIKYGAPYMVQTDRGSQFTSNKFHDIISQQGIIHSMSRPHTPADNVWIETFWKSMKTEIGNVEKYDENEYCMIIDYYMHYYNTTRPHSSLGYIPPLKYRINNQIKNVI